MFNRYAGPPRPVPCPFLNLAEVFFSLACCDPHDADSIADHIGGALLAFGASGHP